MTKPVILCVDDQKVVLDAVWDQIAPKLEEEFTIELCESAFEALELIDDLASQEIHVAVVISDQLMPEMRGDEFLIQVHQRMPQTLKIMLTGQASFESVKNAINNARLYRFISKPWQEDDFILTVTEAARSYQQYLQLIEHNRILRSLNRSTQEISGEMQVQRLVERLLESVLENTGAETCYLVLEHSGELMIDSYAKRMNGILNVSKFIQDSGQKILDNVVNLINSGVLSPYTLVTPIGSSSNKLGYLYVKQSTDEVPFNQNHREVLQMLASQAAISLDNARLVSSLEERTRELKAEKEKAEAISDALKIKTMEVMAQKAELEEIHKIVAQKNRDITDSIEYARRIQLSILPDDNIIEKLFPQSFVYYHAKDIVSGDFYWWSYREPYFVIAACDCTGHGVPGAFMSLLGINFLNQTVNEHLVTEPDAILNYLHIQLRKVLQSQYDQNAKEGMDCAVLTINTQTKQVKMSAARRPVYMFRGGELIVFQGSKCSIGEYVETGDVPFELHELQGITGDRFYLFSDGVTDQFGGEHYRKFTPKRFQQLLRCVQNLPVKEQFTVLEQEINTWRAGNEQTDDMIVLALEI
jgi:serine phosphatase RsbU (regulator of sigma subunit)/FixJ family two-component response regulator